MPRTAARAGALLLCALAAASVHGAQPDKTKVPKTSAKKDPPGIWLLAGREGECVSPTILAKKGPEFSDIKSPYQLAEKLQAAGHKAEIKEFKAGTRPAVEVRAPSAGLHVMFVKQEFCERVAPPPDKK